MHLYLQGNVCIETDLFAPLLDIFFHCDAGEGTNQCATSSNKSSSLDIVCESLLLLINERYPSRTDLIQFVEDKQTRRPWQKYEKQSAAILKHMYGQGFLCVDTDFFAPAEGIPFHLDAGPNTHRCAVYSDKQSELRDFYIEQGVFFEQVHTRLTENCLYTRCTASQGTRV